MDTVAVTGGTGFVATELIKQLLEKGYKVHATVRSTSSPRCDPLRKLGAALPGSLELFEADLLQPGSFDQAFHGCSYIFHPASPFFIEADNPEEALVRPAVEGTLNVLKSAAGIQGLKRVILTSSCAAIKGMKPSPPINGKLYTEEDWNTSSTVEGGEAYWVGKTAAELAAWEFSKEHSLDLVTICPEFIMGPVINPEIHDSSTSVGYMKIWAEGGAQSGGPVFADVRDVARAHVLAAEIDSASGRYIVANPAPTPASVISGWLRESWPQYRYEHVAPPEDREESNDESFIIDNSKAFKELGLVLTPVKQTITDMVRTLYALKVSQKPR